MDLVKLKVNKAARIRDKVVEKNLSKGIKVSQFLLLKVGSWNKEIRGNLRSMEVTCGKNVESGLINEGKNDDALKVQSAWVCVSHYYILIPSRPLADITT